MAKRKRRKFTPEFKAETVKLIRESGRSIGEICRELDLAETAVRSWVRQAEIDAGRGPEGALTSAELEELRRLRRENRELRQEREILKKSDGLRVSRARVVVTCHSPTTLEMRVGPSESGCRIRLQTTSSCIG